MATKGTAPVVAPGWTGDPKRQTAIIDCDIHHSLAKFEVLYPYLPKHYREHVLDQGLLVPGNIFFNVPLRWTRPDLLPQDDPSAVSAGNAREFCTNYEFLRDKHLDVWNIDIGLLTGPPFMLGLSSVADPDYAAAICRAMNDYTLEHWTSRDNRLRVAINVATSDPTQAAKEVDRLGALPEVVGVIVGCGASRPYGNRFYHPLWAACERNGLAVVVHPGGYGGTSPANTAVGHPTYYMEERMARPSQASAHCASLVCEGVFEKYPKLQVAFIEVQQSWLIGLLWHMDYDWRSFRDQTPWLKKPPSEYIRKHIKVGSQPLHEPPQKEQLLAMFEQMHADETLIYASDFPHYDWDDPHTTFLDVSETLRQRIFEGNACDLFHLELEWNR